MNAQTPKDFRENNAKTMQLLNQKPLLTYADIAKMQGITRQRVAQINIKLGSYGRPKYRKIVEERKSAKQKSLDNLLALLESSKGTLWPRRAWGKVVGTATFPSRVQAPVEWTAYANAKQRCTNPKNKMFKNYGERGILFRFNSFEEFWKAVGPIPWLGLTLDRIDNEGHYEFGNVRWATQKQQCAPGKRRNRKKSIQKEPKLLTVE